MKNAKKAIGILLSIVLVLTAIPFAFVPARAEGDTYQWAYDAETKTLTVTGTGALPDFEMTEEPTELFEISPWLAAAKDAEHLVIGENITEIGDFNFALMGKLTTAELPSTLTRIGQYAFAYCGRLREADLPAGLTELGESAFSFNDLQSVEIPAGIEDLTYNFIYQGSLASVTLHEGLKTITGCFINSPLQSLTIPSTVTSVQECSFIDMKTLVNNSAQAVASDQLLSVAEPGMGAVLCKYYNLSIQMELEYLMSGEEISPEEEEQYEARIMEELRLWLNETYGAGLQTAEETRAYIAPYMNVNGFPRADVEISCLSESAEHTRLDAEGLPHYLIDRNNELCDVAPHGMAGDSIEWTLDTETGVLTFTGRGDMYSSLYNAGYKFYRSDVTSVSFVQQGGAITSIGAEAFRGLTNLTSLTVPNGVRRIGSEFIMDSGVRNLTLPAGLEEEQTSYWLRLGTTPLESIALSAQDPFWFTFNGGLYRNGYGGGSYLSKLPSSAASLPLHADVKSIRPYAVEGIADLAGFTVPGTVTYISEDAFYNLPALETVTFAPGTDNISVSGRFCGGTTRVMNFVTDPADTRIAAVDGVLYNKDVTVLYAIPGGKTEVDLPATAERIGETDIYLEQKLDRLTVRNPAFDFGQTAYDLSFVNKHTVIAGYRNSTAEDYALTHGNPLELLDGVTVTGVSLDFTDASLTIPQYEAFRFADFNVKAVVTYSDGATAVKSGDALRYEFKDENGSAYYDGYTFNTQGEYTFTVSYGDVRETFTATVGPSSVVYEFDTSEMIDEISVFENFNPSEMNIKLYKVNGDGTREEVSFWEVEVHYWDETAGETGWTENTGTRTFTSPRDVRLLLEYRGASEEVTLHVTENLVKFTMDASAFAAEAERFSIYDKNTCGLRLYVTRNGETAELTPDMNVYDDSGEFDWYTSRFLNTMETGPVQAHISCEYHYQDPVRGYVDFTFSYPFTVNVVQGDVASVALDVSDVPETVLPYAYYTPGTLGIKLVKTLTNGETVIDDDPNVMLEIANGSSFSYSESLSTMEEGVVYRVTARYLSLEESFTLTVRQAGQYEIDLSNAKLTFRQYLEPFSIAALNVRIFRTENGVTEEITDLDRISYGWSDDHVSANGLGVHTVELYYSPDGGNGEKVGSVQYEVVSSGAELVMNGTPTEIAQFDPFAFSAELWAYDDGARVKVADPLYYYVSNANGWTVSYNTLSTSETGVFTVTPYANIGGQTVWFYELKFTVTVTPVVPEFRLDKTNLVTEVETYALYSADTWGVKGWRVRDGADVEEVMVQFWFELPDGTRNDNCIPTDAPATFVLHPYIFYGNSYYEIDDPITVTVTESGFTYTFTDVTYTNPIKQFAPFSLRAKLTTYRNGQVYQNMTVYKYLAEDSAGTVYDNYLFTQITGDYTITPYYDYNGNRLLGEPFTLTVEPVPAPALAPTDERTVACAEGVINAFTFTAPVLGSYTFSAVFTESTPADALPVASFYGDDMMVAFMMSPGSGAGNGFAFTRAMQAGESYTITVSDYHNTVSEFLFRVDHAHQMTFTAGTPATCTTDGIADSYVCGVCGKTFADADGNTELENAVIPAAHTLEYNPEIEAFCDAPGRQDYWHCTVCGRNFWDEACTDEITNMDNLTVYTMHHMTKVPGTPATCEADGTAEYWYCSSCQKKYADSVGLTLIENDAELVIPGGHVMVEHPGAQATCEADGNLPYYECTRCGNFYVDGAGENLIADHSEVILPAHHTLTAHAAKAAGCETAGNVAYWKCTACGKCFTDENGVNLIAQADTVLPAHHTLTRTAGKAATCKEAGNVEYWTCSVCGKTFSDANGAHVITDTVLPKTDNHAWNSGEVIQPATCTAAGKKLFTCTVCGKTREETVGKTAHRDDNNDGLCDYGCGTQMGGGGQQEQPTQPDQPSGEKCKLCGEVHTGFFGKIVGFFHRIIYFFQNLFKR